MNDQLCHIIEFMSYKATHPFLVFDVNLKALPPRVWTWIGEIIAMCKSIEAMPLPDRDLNEFHRLQLATGALASAAIEGNTSSKKDAIELAQGTRKPVKYQDIEIHNLLQLYRDATDDVFLGFGKLSRDWLCEINRRVLDQVALPGTQVVPGEVRSHLVGMGTYRVPDQAYCGDLISRFCEFFSSHRFWRASENAMGYSQTAILKAIVAHLYVAWIHPCGDGNGRTARMVEFMLLFQGNLPAVAGFSLCRHYHATRPEYYLMLEESSFNREDYTLAPLDFVMYAVKGLMNAIEESVKEMQLLHENQYWEDLLDEAFPGGTKTESRLKAMALALGTREGALTVSQIRGAMAADSYFEPMTYQTLTRGLRTLIAGGWAKRTARGKYASCKNDILSKRSSPIIFRS